MRYRTPHVVFLLLALALPLWAQGQFALEVRTDRAEALYHVNEPVVFSIALMRGKEVLGEGKVAYTLSNDGEETLGQGTIVLSGGPAQVTGTLDKPGFLRCTAEFAGPDGKTIKALGGAGIDPLDIHPSLPVPDDFDAFWTEKKAELAKIPMNPRLTPVDSSKNGVVCFDVQLDCLGGAPVSGYFARPAIPAAKSLPALLCVHGAGVRSSIKPLEDAAKGLLAFDINAHGIPNGRPKDYYEELAENGLKDYRYRGREQREIYYFLGMYLRLVRALDFLTAQPEWDGKELIVSGGSQGGGQAIVAAGIDARVTAFAANVPAMCEHTGRVNGWPRLVPRDASGVPDPIIQEVARYFDAMNFATRTNAEAVLSVGFIDDTCRPTSVYAAYNNLPGKKRIINEPRMTHTTWQSYTDARNALIAAHGGVPGPLRDVRRIVFLGDSITQAGDYVTDFDGWLISQDLDIEVINLGLGSETAADLTQAENAGHVTSFGFGRPAISERLERVLAETKPDLLFVCYGMNDAGSLPPDAAGDRRFEQAITRLRATALQSGVKRVVLCTPPVHDAKGDTGQQVHDANLTRYSAWLMSKKVEGWDVVDIHGPMRAALEERRAKEPGFLFAADGVHPGREGHWLMAAAILTQWLGAPVDSVSSAEQLFPEKGGEIRPLVRERMSVLFAAWMSKIGHTRPGVTGAPDAPPGPSIQEANAKAAEITQQITQLRGK